MREEQQSFVSPGPAINAAVPGEREQTRRATAEDLISMVAHDLRGYLTPLSGYIALLRASAEREGRERDARNAAAAATAITDIVHMTSRLLTAHRLDRGPLVPDIEPLDLAVVVRQVVSAVAGPGAIVRIEAPEHLPCAGDPALLREALANLVSNALRYAPPDTPVSVHVDVTQEDEEGRAYATVQVSDRGPGIAPELLPHIFEQFTADTHSTGLGLGLYLAHAIACAHGGDLTVTSMVGHGATFQLVLPVTNRRQSVALEPGDWLGRMMHTGRGEASRP